MKTIYIPFHQTLLVVKNQRQTSISTVRVFPGRDERGPTTGIGWQQSCH